MRHMRGVQITQIYDNIQTTILGLNNMEVPKAEHALDARNMLIRARDYYTATGDWHTEIYSRLQKLLTATYYVK
jgi:hypothetical protein